MKKYILTPVTQKNHTFYSMVADPREIVTAVKRAGGAGKAASMEQDNGA